MAAARFYSSTSGSINLSTGIGSGDTSITVSTTTGLPGTTPFSLVIDPGTATEEIVNVTNVSGTTLTITRGVDGSSAQAHSAGVSNIRHMATARDFREPQEHIGASAAVHGVAGSVVGTTDVQTLTNKTAVAGSAATVGLVVRGAAAQTAAFLDVQDSASASILKVSPTSTGTVTVAGTTFVNTSDQSFFSKYTAKLKTFWADTTALILTRTAAQTANLMELRDSNDSTVLAKFDKDANLTVPQVVSTGAVSGTTGTFSGQAQSNSLNVVTLSETQTLTNKTLTSPTITGTGAIAGASGTFSGNIAAANAVTAVGGVALLIGGPSVVTFNASGEYVLTHGLGVIPKFISITQDTGTAASALHTTHKISTATTTQVTVTAMVIATGAAYVGAATIRWIAAA